MSNIDLIIKQCLENCKPPVDLYSEGGDGYYKIRQGVVADIESATENLQSVLNPYLKSEEEQGEIVLLKIDNAFLRGKVKVYEKFLKRNGLIADVEDEEDEDDEQIEKENNNG